MLKVYPKKTFGGRAPPGTAYEFAALPNPLARLRRGDPRLGGKGTGNKNGVWARGKRANE